MIQFLSWVADRPRSYTETMEAWQTTCAKFSPWEDAVIGGAGARRGSRGEVD
jgi:hypothetical protein